MQQRENLSIAWKKKNLLNEWHWNKDFKAKNFIKSSFEILYT